jgi:hypothetical protein
MDDFLIINNEWIQMLLRFVFNLLFTGIIIKIINQHSSEISRHTSTFFIISVIVFFLCFTLRQIDLNFGMALGLFAIFGIIRYRTDPIPIKEMTYLFLVIGVSVVNALANKKISHAELLFANLAIVFVTYGMEKLWLLKHESRKNITYEKIELIIPSNTIAKLANNSSAWLIFLLARAFTTDTPITKNKYVISLIGIGSVRYRIIPKIANKPRAIPKLRSICLSVKHKKNTITLIIKNVDVCLLISLLC